MTTEYEYKTAHPESQMARLAQGLPAERKLLPGEEGWEVVTMVPVQGQSHRRADVPPSFLLLCRRPKRLKVDLFERIVAASVAGIVGVVVLLGIWYFPGLDVKDRVQWTCGAFVVNLVIDAWLRQSLKAKAGRR